MRKLLVRHALSNANNRELYGTPAFGNPNSGLMPEGINQAINLGAFIVSEYGINISEENVATSRFRRTQQTATIAGFRHIYFYSSLNEVKGNLSDIEVREAINLKNPPKETKLAARNLINNPSIEDIWFTHGLLIAALCQELGLNNYDRFIPKFCEIREIEL